MFCTKCGKELSDSAAFCTNCGAKTGSPAQSGSASVADGNDVKKAATVFAKSVANEVKKLGKNAWFMLGSVGLLFLGLLYMLFPVFYVTASSWGISGTVSMTMFFSVTGVSGIADILSVENVGDLLNSTGVEYLSGVHIFFIIIFLVSIASAVAPIFKTKFRRAMFYIAGIVSEIALLLYYLICTIILFSINSSGISTGLGFIGWFLFIYAIGTIIVLLMTASKLKKNMSETRIQEAVAKALADPERQNGGK